MSNNVVDIRTGKKRGGKTVPLGVFRQVRDELKATKAMNDTLTADNRRLRHRLKFLGEWLLKNDKVSERQAIVIWHS